MASTSNFEAFLLNGSENWESYIDRLECYFEANDITDIRKKRSVLLSACGKEAFALLRNLLAPAKPRDTAFDVIVKTMADHLNPQPAEIAQRHIFYRRDQQDGE